MTDGEKKTGSTDGSTGSGTGDDSGANGGSDSQGDSSGSEPDWKLTTIKKSKDSDETTIRERRSD